MNEWCVRVAACLQCVKVKGVSECWFMFTLCMCMNVCESVHIHTMWRWRMCMCAHIHTVWGWRVWMLVHVHTVCIGEGCEWVLVLVHTVCVGEWCAWLMARVYTVWEDKNNMCECWCTLTALWWGRCWNNFGSCFSFLSLPVLNSACQGLCVECSNPLSQSTAVAFKTLIWNLDLFFPCRFPVFLDFTCKGDILYTNSRRQA